MSCIWGVVNIYSVCVILSLIAKLFSIRWYQFSSNYLLFSVPLFALALCQSIS